MWTLAARIDRGGPAYANLRIAETTEDARQNQSEFRRYFRFASDWHTGLTVAVLPRFVVVSHYDPDV